VLDQQIDTSDAAGRLLFNMLGMIAPFETALRTVRHMDGIQSAKARGVRLGRQKTLTPQQIAEVVARHRQGTLIRTLVKDYRISKAMVYRYLSTGDATSNSR